MKYLIVSGDSFTDSWFESIYYPDMDCSWPKWPEILAEKLGMELINLGRGGAGNKYIYTELLDTIMGIENKSEIGLIISAWTQSNREDYQVRGKWHRRKVHAHGDIVGWINTSLRYYTGLQLLCERYNLPYYQFQMIDFYHTYINNFREKEDDGFYHKKYTGDIVQDKNLILNTLNAYDKIDVNTFIGWPITKELGGFAMSDLILGDRLEYPENRIADLDQHPNELGQQKLAEGIYAKINKLSGGNI